ncbi:hypothetical protein [Streptomyces aidingensis]|uniref:Secreted protein n=1 Tax=Streptomyces aidingensis TaxID=910347 RepID=A0A1I1IPT0_9ACTN|nr:hypothetical protein [Streptomyces aidingensis]SFC38224.1 hypothetical protein SAMN05421773_103140 [Streptomyces aidingensis]
MSALEWIIVLAVLAAVVLAFALPRPLLRSSRGNLRRRFGPEYDRTVRRHGGDEGAARRELADRLRHHGRLHPLPLSPADRRRYQVRWSEVQQRFVEWPDAAVAEADHLLTQLVHDRGYPAEAHEQQVAALSVHHPEHVDGYRRVHALAGRGHGGAGGMGTEELREAMIGARELFEDLVEPQPEDRDPDDRPEAADNGHHGHRGTAVLARLRAPWHRDGRQHRRKQDREQEPAPRTGTGAGTEGGPR